MHPSTIAAILAFTAGMPASAAPANRQPNPYAGLGHIAVMPDSKEHVDLFNKISGRASRGSRVGKAFSGVGDAVSAVSDFLTIGQAVQGAQQNAKRDPQRSSKQCANFVNREQCEEAFRPQLAIPYPEMQLGSKKVARGNRLADAAGQIAQGVRPVDDLVNNQHKREAKGGSIGNGCLTTPCADILPTTPFRGVQKQEEETQSSEKRDAQRSKGRIISNIVKGVGGALGGAADTATVVGAVQGQQKRDAQKSKGEVFWTAPPAQSGGDIPLPEKREANEIGGKIHRCPITGCRDELFLGVPVNFRREAQRSKGKVIGNIVKGVGGALGGAADTATIVGAVQGQPAQKREAQKKIIGGEDEIRCMGFPGCYDTASGLGKREAQKSKGKIIGNIVKGVGGVIGGAADTATIVGAVNGQGQPAQKREAQKNPIGGKSGGHCQAMTGCGRRDDIIILGREAQRSKGNIIGNIVKGVGGVIGGAADTATIVGAVNGQGQPAQ
ncbi:hypothetical protein TUN199_04966 [Pyrenophora tritici-repentis]|uniref:Atrophin-1 domain containing protein n=1 Tax=Pyrenophora tritici-repentis TaxID=45151 RepID=A0A2W1EDQ1_9PLEO|nr:hypothetical protein PtrV1_00240 [Pyrenophora tritici-repentis]KAF7452961.1 hypothetical protein A1F99_002190 [Pyrenophora tritici-repentis]KAF7576006.1 Atrophin-1 domain containing protein [Pyrenophora tritici-repentis]KAI0579805.1 hypothetical protein Alg215_05550 [Pyrenophora tritici-repentis]KAI0585213.1 hypothetical protein Alg130_04853 [Pyrenophora tritici-repentis]